MVDAAAILARRSPNIHFFLVGDGPEKEKLLQKVRQHSISNITFLDPVPKSQVPSLLKQADLLLHCLKPLNVFRHGISPNKMYDYLASAKPVIMSAEAVNNIVQEAQAGITVEPGNPEALAEGILRLYRLTPEERERLGANGRSYVEKYHDINILSEKLAEVIRSVIR